MFVPFLALGTSFGQSPTTGNAEFDAELESLLPKSVPFISVEELRNKQDQFVIFDIREKEEYEVSHIPGAQFMGYKNCDMSLVDGLPKDTPIVVYCSIGYRSGKVGKKLKGMGFTNVKNLYGSIFEWANENCPLENSEGKPTEKVHTYNEKWSRWVENPGVEKVW